MKAADQGSAWGQYNLSWCYQSGAGVNQDNNEWIKYTSENRQYDKFIKKILNNCVINLIMF